MNRSFENTDEEKRVPRPKTGAALGAPVRGIYEAASSESIEEPKYVSQQEDNPISAPPAALPPTVPKPVLDGKGRTVDGDFGIPPPSGSGKGKIYPFIPGTLSIKRKDVRFADGPNFDPYDDGPGKQVALAARPSSDGPRVRLILQGTGGVFAFGDTSLKTDSGSELQRDLIHVLQPGQHIGTKFCGTGVGVYFEIEKNLCFCAHIDVETGRSDPASTDVTKSERTQTTKAIAGKLAELSTKQGWRKQDIKRGTLTVVGRLVADYRIQMSVLEGICEFIGPDKYSGVFVSTRKHGFIVVPGSRDSLKWLDIVAVLNDDVYKVPPGFDFVGDENMPRLEWTYSCSEGWKKPRFGSA